ncbi:MAG TPA: carbon-nitrogen hydrolase family protein [Candidatus Deferrimicrobium sp.]|nr:carbon-nitrogen hydrolase family protein [Candidatus Deferrimicrobium sp.]
MKDVRIGLIQFRIDPERSTEKTLYHAKELIERASKEGAQIVCLPERWNYKKGTMDENLEAYSGPAMKFLSNISAELGIYLIGGAIWVYNQNKTENHIICGIFNPKGDLIEVQRKLHLYLYEKSFFIPGKELKIIDTSFGKIGVAICFDMTFPEIARYYALNNVDLIVSPVLIREEGIENWHIYLKARALENRMPIGAVNCIGRFSDRNYPGVSCLIDFQEGHETPSKLNVREAPFNEEMVLIDNINLDTARKLRKKRLAERLEIDNKILSKKI